MSPSILRAIIETQPPLVVTIDRDGDAARLANLTHCRVRLETIFEPETVPVALAGVAEVAVTATAGRNASPRRASLSAQPASLPSRMLARFEAQPDHVFGPSDFLDLEKNVKAVMGTLSRLAEREVITRVTHGKYQHGKPTSAKPADRASYGEASAAVMQYMRKHPGERLNPGQVTEGMGLPRERRHAILAAMFRLSKTHKLEKHGALYSYPLPEGSA